MNGKVVIGVKILKDQFKKDMKSIKQETKDEAQEIEQTFQDTGVSSGAYVKTLGKVAIALGVIAGTVATIKKSIKAILQDDKQLSANVDYLKFTAQTMVNNLFLAIGNKLKPLIEGIVDLAYRLLTYINYISMAWFGVNLMAGATTEEFQKQSKALAGMSKVAKQLEKTLLGFDKINKLDSKSDSGSSGGGAGAIPTLEMQQIEIPEWLVWIKDHKDEVIAGLVGIAGGLTAVYLGATPLQGLGIGLALTGITGLIEDLPGYLDNLDSSLEDSGTSWEEFGDILDDVSLSTLGVGIATGNLPLIILGAAGLIYSTIMKNWTQIKEKLQEAENWINDKIDWLEERTNFIGSFIKGIWRGVRDFVVDYFKGILKPIKNIVDGILLIFKGDLEGGIKTIGKGIINFLISILNRLIDAVNLFFTPFRAIIVGVSKILGKSLTIDNIKIPRVNYLARGGIIVNRPGQGVPVGANTFGGEKSYEGVLPLTDESAMSRLGLEIGKHVKVNADITLEIERRVLARVMQEIQGDSAFVRNGG